MQPRYTEPRYEPRPGNGLMRSEARVAFLRKAGLTASQIVKQTQYTPRVVARCFSMASDGGSTQMINDLRQGSDALAKALGEVGRHTEVPTPDRTPVGRSRLVGLQRATSGVNDRRKVVSSAEPCPNCCVRGDYPEGCRHQRPDPDWLAGLEVRT
jgi:hypothetical protein